MTEELERLQYAWTSDGEVPAASTRVRFRPGGDDEFLGLFVQVARGSLDVETQRSVEELGEQGQARDDLDFYLGCPGERDWWRVALDGDGCPVGFAIPSATLTTATSVTSGFCRLGVGMGWLTTCWARSRVSTPDLGR